MILLDQQLDEWVQKSAKNHVFVETEKKIPASAYFLIGSFSSDGDIHVAHASKCPMHMSALAEDADEKSKLLDDEWMSDNAERLLRILPGGIHIIGIAWFSSRAEFDARRNSIRKTMARVQKMNNSLTTMGLDGSISEQMVTVFYETPGTKPEGYLMDFLNRGAETAAKINFQKLEWISLVSNASARVVFNVPLKDEKNPDFYRDFVATIRQFATNFFTCDLMLLDGVVRDDNEPLIKDLKKNKKSTVEAQLFLNPLYNRSNQATEEVASNLHEVMFDIELRAAVPIRTNVKDAKRALKHHLIRNLCSRAELHYESMEVVEEVNPSSSPSVHQLPRPCTTVLYSQPSILLNDFLFEADSVEDAQKNFDDMMDLQTSIEHVDDGWERALTPEEMDAIRQPIEDLKYVEYDPSADTCCTTRTLLITIAIIIGLIASIIYFTVAHS
ncbi:unnamed protein product [Caenorhabditis bovis]|uniref:Uncharacterized protein n=1 Tax=Caenorhabditis bovis TaxID=2654633 RepID=A0A8S1EV57_9PELO|nr:unnamed protein product [Caenorhabditis bovis]